MGDSTSISKKCSKCGKELDKELFAWTISNKIFCQNCINSFGELVNLSAKMDFAPGNGIRHHEGKPRWDLLAYDVLEEVAKVMTKGAEKHGLRDWEKGVSYNDYFSAVLRHLSKWHQGESMDESGFNHLAHAMCNVMILFASELRKIGEDDRPKINKEEL